MMSLVGLLLIIIGVLGMFYGILVGGGVVPDMTGALSFVLALFGFILLLIADSDDDQRRDAAKFGPRTTILAPRGRCVRTPGGVGNARVAGYQQREDIP